MAAKEAHYSLSNKNSLSKLISKSKVIYFFGYLNEEGIFEFPFLY